MNPYSGVDFFEFFGLFFKRFLHFPLASDEIQVFVLAFIAIGAALVGTLLKLKKMTMLANSLSHTILLGIVGAFLLFSSTTLNFSALFVAAMITGLVTTVLTQFLHQRVKLQEDASIGLVFTTLFALGIVLVTLYTRNAHIGLEVVMGSADALHFDVLKLASAVAFVNLFFVTLFFKEWKLVCFDSSLASSLGYRPAVFNYLLMFLTSCTAISAFRAVGVLLFLSFLVGLPTIARLWTHNLKKMFVIAVCLGFGVSLFSVALSRHLLSVYNTPLSTAGIAVSLIGLIFFFSAVGSKLTFRKIPA